MAEKTHRKARGAVPQSSLRQGAAGGAPTAPHATPRPTPSAGPKMRVTGPERFWSGRRVRVALGVSAAVSIVLHYVIGPWTVVPEGSVELHDVGELSIPVDLLAGEAPPAPPPLVPPEPTAAAPKAADPNGAAAGKRDAGPRHDAATDGASSDARAADGAFADAAPPDASIEGGREASSSEAGGAGEAGVPSDAGPVASTGIADGGPGRGGPHDAIGMIGMAGGVQAGPQNVVLVVNMAVIRSHPVGAKLGPLLSAIPQWDDFLGGTKIDPVRDTDWVMINGPSLRDTGRDAILIHYSASDAVVDRAITIVAKKYEHGGPFDAGVPGVKAALGKADRYERVFLRPQPHLAAVVPKDYATTAALLLHRAELKAPRAGEAMRVTLQRPHDSIQAQRMGVEIPASISELRIWVVPRADGGADVYGEGDTPSAEAAAAAADDMRKLVRSFRRNIIVAIASQGLLEGVELGSEGSTMRMHLVAQREQIQAIAELVAGQLGVDLHFGPTVDP